MTILKVITNVAGQGGVEPRRVTVLCTDNLATVTTAGFLDQSSKSGETIQKTDEIHIIYDYSKETKSGTLGIFVPTINSAGSITLTAMSATIPDGSITTAKLADSAVTTAKIANANVNLPKLSAGITPTHIVKFAGKFVWEVPSATVVIDNLTGMDATNYIGFAQVQSSANAVTVQKVTPGVDQMIVLLSGDPGAGTVISYQALLAVS